MNSKTFMLLNKKRNREPHAGGITLGKCFHFKIYHTTQNTKASCTRPQNINDVWLCNNSEALCNAWQSQSNVWHTEHKLSQKGNTLNILTAGEKINTDDAGNWHDFKSKFTSQLENWRWYTQLTSSIAWKNSKHTYLDKKKVLDKTDTWIYRQTVE